MSYTSFATRRASAALLATLLLLAGWTGTAPSARADTAPTGTTPATVAADALPTWQVDGVVYAQVVVGTTVYATGLFATARPPGVVKGGTGQVAVGNLIAYDIRTGERVTAFNHTLDAQGLAITASPDGSRVYVGGDFTSVDGQSRAHLAAFDTRTGALVSTFAPVVNDEVKALTASATTVYAGGEFTAVTQAGTVYPRRFLASFGATDGKVTTWAPTADNGYAWSLVLTPDKTKVIAGGQFQTVNGTAVNGMAALDATTGAVRPWAANTVIKDYHMGSIDTLSTDGTYVYGGGFAFGDGGGFEGSFSLNPADGSIRWLADCQGDTYGVQPVGPVVYTVGHVHNCSMIGAFPDTTPTTKRWQSGTAFTVAPSGVNSGPDVYKWNFAGKPKPALLHWFPQLALGTVTGQSQAAWTVAAGSGYVVLGGEFPKVNGALQQGLTRFATSSVAPDKVGPKYDDTVPARTAAPATTASLSGTTMTIGFGAAWDLDNTRLTYAVYRDRGTAGEKLVATKTVDSSFWVLPAQTVSDPNVPTGSHRYQVVITDPFGNALLSPVSNLVTVGGNLAPTADFTSTVDRLTASFSGTPSSDPDGSISAYAWSFGDGRTGSGATTTHAYAQPGSYSVRLTVTDNGGATGTLTRTVTVAAQAAPRVQDTFTRTVSAGWGSAEIGGAWTLVGSSSLFSVAGGQGAVVLNAGSGPSARLAASSTDTDLSLSFALDKAATGGGLFVRPVVRGDATNGYLAKVWASGTSQALTLYLTRVVSGTEVDLGHVVLPFSLTPGTRYHVRVQAVGSGTTTLRARAWVDGSGEPTTWSLSTTDTTAALQAAGGVSVHGYAGSKVTNAPVTLRVDDVLVRPTTG